MNVLVPYDGSDPAKTALEHSLDTFEDATVMALYVVDTGPGSLEDPPERDILGDNLTGLYEGREQRGRELLEEAQSVADEYGVTLETAVEFGRAHTNIIEYIEDGDVDHIVIGSHGRTGASRVLLGSVAEKVVRRSPVPVTVVR